MSILDKYGIKEVADVTFYEIDSDGKPGAPVLFLDTLKVSTIEQTAEQVFAQGGKGNTKLIGWDFGKEISVALEDALFSEKSMAVMFSGGKISATGATVLKTVPFTGATPPTQWESPNGKVNIASGTIYDASGSSVATASATAGVDYFYTFEYNDAAASVINIDASTFPGTYYVTGDTFRRSEKTGKDELFQFVIPKAKMSAENTITLEAEGDPTVFNMNLEVLRADDGTMMKLIAYTATTT